MMFPLGGSTGWTAALVEHLWQSTMICTALGALSLMLRRNAARMRFRLWMLASVKFLLPFSLLIAAGESLSIKRTVVPTVAPLFSMVVEGPANDAAVSPRMATPKVSATAHVEAAITKKRSTELVMGSVFFVWVVGALSIIGIWLRRWLHLRTLVRRGTPLGDIAGLQAVMVASDAEPGVFGILRPVLMLPSGVTRNLTTTQMEAIVAHELCHVRRRDNLTAVLHMFVSAVFWFHPLVWWIGRQLIAEREAACDEAVLEQSHCAMEYAEGILNVCKFYLEVPVACVSGVTGADLKKRRRVHRGRCRLLRSEVRHEGIRASPDGEAWRSGADREQRRRPHRRHHRHDWPPRISGDQRTCPVRDYKGTQSVEPGR